MKSLIGKFIFVSSSNRIRMVSQFKRSIWFVYIMHYFKNFYDSGNEILPTGVHTGDEQGIGEKDEGLC